MIDPVLSEGAGIVREELPFAGFGIARTCSQGHSQGTPARPPSDSCEVVSPGVNTRGISGFRGHQVIWIKLQMNEIQNPIQWFPYLQHWGHNTS